MNTKTNIFNYPHPFVTVDVLILTVVDNDLRILLVKRKDEPFKNYWSIPGGFVQIDESLDEAAVRALQEKTGVKDVYLEQLYSFGDINRDPRAMVLTVSYFALTPSNKVGFSRVEDVGAAWFSVKSLPVLAFDHKKIIKYGIERLKAKIGYSNIAFGLLPSKFRLSELQKVYEVILGHQIDKRNFRKKMSS